MKAVLAVVTMVTAVAGCGDSGGGSGGAVAACINRGIIYFKEIDAWPKLSDGRDAESVASERCNRTTTAF